MNASIVFVALISLFRVAFVGDPQVDDERELSYARASIYRELRERKDLDLVVLLGDLVNDCPEELLSASKESLDSLGCPWVCAIGNHDRDSALPRRVETFRRIIGYEDTTFVMKGVRFICMNDVRLEGRAGYEGGFREDQKEWLKKVLQDTPQEMKAVIATHIPFNEFSSVFPKGREPSEGELTQADSLAAILALHPNTMLVAGHTHCVRNSILSFSDGNSYPELIVGASCGSWWRGFPDEHGIPAAWMNSGDPRGYYTVDFERRKTQKADIGYRIGFKPVGGTRLASATLMEDGRVLVNIYGGREEGSVEIRCKGQRIDCSRVGEVAPEALSYLEFMRSSDRAYRKEHKELFIPILRHKCLHLWAISGSGLQEGDILKIRYRDSHMKVRTETAVKVFSLPR